MPVYVILCLQLFLISLYCFSNFSRVIRFHLFKSYFVLKLLLRHFLLVLGIFEGKCHLLLDAVIGYWFIKTCIAMKVLHSWNTIPICHLLPFTSIVEFSVDTAMQFKLLKKFILQRNSVPGADCVFCTRKVQLIQEVLRLRVLLKEGCVLRSAGSFDKLFH